MTQLFIIYQIEGGGIGYKPAKVNLPVGARICVDRKKMVFARVEKVVSTTAEDMAYKWRAAKGQNRLIGTPNYFKFSFLGMFDDED